MVGGHRKVAACTPHAGQAGGQESSGGTLTPPPSISVAPSPPPPRSHRPWTSQVYRAKGSGSTAQPSPPCCGGKGGHGGGWGHKRVPRRCQSFISSSCQGLGAKVGVGHWSGLPRVGVEAPTPEEWCGTGGHGLRGMEVLGTRLGLDGLRELGLSGSVVLSSAPRGWLLLREHRRVGTMQRLPRAGHKP